MNDKELPVFSCNNDDGHREALAAIQAQEPTRQELASLAELYKMLGDPTRVRILSALSMAEFCVSCLAEALDMSQSAISHQLRLLKQGRLVRSRKEGRTVYYTLDDDHVAKIFRQGLEHIRE